MVYEVKTEYFECKQKTERHKLSSAQRMPAKIAANAIRTHARINQRRTLARASAEKFPGEPTEKNTDN